MNSAADAAETCCSRYWPPAIQLRGSPRVALILAVKLLIATTVMFDSMATRNRRIGPDRPSTGPVVERVPEGAGARLRVGHLQGADVSRIHRGRSAARPAEFAGRVGGGVRRMPASRAAEARVDACGAVRFASAGSIRPAAVP